MTQTTISPDNNTYTSFLRMGTMTMVQQSSNTQPARILNAGTYTVRYNQLTGYYLEDLALPVMPQKVYGNPQKRVDRILKTFEQRPNGTGVMLSGEKGSGKSLLTMCVATEAISRGYPVLMVNDPFSDDEFKQMIKSIVQPCVIIMDEFEKVYDTEQQQQLLTLLDGAYSSKKLFLFSLNDANVSDFYINRPGRVYYWYRYDGLSQDFIREYCEDVLIDKSAIESVSRLATVNSTINFDMLKAIVEEMNRYNEPLREVLNHLNIRMYNERVSYTCTLSKDGEILGSETMYQSPIGRRSFTIDVSLPQQKDPTTPVSVDDDDDEAYVNISVQFMHTDYQVGLSRTGKHVFTNADGYTVICARDDDQSPDMYSYLEA